VYTDDQYDTWTWSVTAHLVLFLSRPFDWGHTNEDRHLGFAFSSHVSQIVDIITPQNGTYIATSLLGSDGRSRIDAPNFAAALLWKSMSERLDFALDEAVSMPWDILVLCDRFGGSTCHFG
jgi:hypothetical protein